MNVVALKGSEKQINWATTIREGALAHIDVFMADIIARRERAVAEGRVEAELVARERTALAFAYQAVAGRSEASSWINSRNNRPAQWLYETATRPSHATWTAAGLGAERTLVLGLTERF